MPPALAASFDEAADYYDRQPNPVLALEERFLPGLLPDLRDLDVVDVGCGTGRWLEKIRQHNPRSLTGVDPSGRMLDVARWKTGNTVRLMHGKADRLPIADASADLVLLSFALSYCAKLEEVAAELVRIARPHANVFVTDLHPVTEARLDWKRTFASSAGSLRVQSYRYEISTIAAAFRKFGLRLVCHLDLPFGREEEALLARAGKEAAATAARNLPVIYIAQLTRLSSETSSTFVFDGARIALGATPAANASVAIAGDTTECISSARIAPRSAAQELDLRGCLLLPGLINAHDHLEFGLFPNLGRGPYTNSLGWAEDIHAYNREVIDLHSSIPKDVRLYWGGLRNLLCGVTSVCHHNPSSPVFRHGDFPVRVVDTVDWAHSLSFDPDVENTFAHSSPDRAFIIHAAEGIDQRAAREIDQLNALGILTDHTVLVHGVGLSPKSVDLLNARGTALVICPSSNFFLFRRSLAPDLLADIQHVALGTDSPLTALGDLLDELRFAATNLQIPQEQLYAMCTSAPASILKMRNGEGSLRIGAFADFLVVHDNGSSPASQLLALQLSRIELIFIGGKAHLASETGLRRLPEAFRSGLYPLEVEGQLFWARAPLPWMFEQAHAVLGPEIILGCKEVSYAG